MDRVTLPIESVSMNSKLSWQPEWVKSWPLALVVLDDLLTTRYPVKTTHIVRGEKGVGTSYHSQQTSITTIVEQGDPLEYPKPISYSMKGSSASLLSWLNEEQYDAFVQAQEVIHTGDVPKQVDQVVTYAGQKFGVRYNPHIFSPAPLFNLNTRDLTLYQALVTRALEIDVKRATEFFNNKTMDDALAAHLSLASDRVFHDYSMFLVSLLYRCSGGWSI
jgi:hypothetical protein